MSYSELDTDLLLLAAEDNERKAKERLRALSPDEWRELREAITRLDEWLDDTVLEQLERTRARRLTP